MTPWKARLSLLALAGFTSTNYPVMKIAVKEISPYSLIVWRFLFAIVFLVAIQPRVKFRVSGSVWRDGAIPGSLLGAAMILLALAMQRAGSGEAAFFVSSDAAFVPVFSLFLFRILPPWQTIAGVAFAIPGLGLLSLQNGFTFREGSIAGIASAIMFALWLLALDRVTKRNHPFALSLSQMSAALVVTGLLSICFGELQVPGSLFPWLACLYLGAVGTGLRFAIQAFIQRFVDPTESALIYLFEPVCAALLGALFLSEVMTFTQMAGCALILFGIACPLLRKKLKASIDSTSVPAPALESGSAEPIRKHNA